MGFVITDIGLITVVIHFKSKAILKINYLVDRIQLLHKQPDVYVRRFAIVEG